MNLMLEHWLQNIRTEEFITQQLGGVRVKCDASNNSPPALQPLMDSHPVVLPQKNNHIWVPTTPVPTGESIFSGIVGVQPMSNYASQVYTIEFRWEK